MEIVLVFGNALEFTHATFFLQEKQGLRGLFTETLLFGHLALFGGAKGIPSYRTSFRSGGAFERAHRVIRALSSVKLLPLAEVPLLCVGPGLGARPGAHVFLDFIPFFAVKFKGL